MRFYVGPWVWTVDPVTELARYRAPTDTIHALDLRSLPDCGTPNSTNGNGLFVMPDAAAPGADYVEVPQNFTLATRNAVRNKLQLPQAIIAAGRAGFVLELLTRHAVPDGSTFCRPLMPNRRGRLRLFFNEVAEDFTFDTTSVFWAKIQAVLWENYRRYREAVIAGTMPEDFHRRYLSVLLEKFAGRITDYHEFIPTDLPDETPLPHSTIYTDNFSNAFTYTVTEYGGGPAWSFIYGVYLNMGGTMDRWGREEQNLAGDDHYAEFTVADDTNAWPPYGLHLIVRYDGSGNSNWYSLEMYADVTYRHGITKCVNTVQTILTWGLTTFPDEPYPIYISIDGSDLIAKHNGTQVLSVTDTSLTGYTKVGFGRGWSTSNVLMDKLEFGDLAAADILSVAVREITEGVSF